MIADVKNLITELTKKINNKTGLIIGIDGYDGAGKTTLGEKVSESLKVKQIDLDKYIIKKNNNFINNINNDKLITDIELLIVNRNLIISGICLMNILDQINIKIDVLIYVMRYDHTGMSWQDEDDCTFQGIPRNKIIKIIERWNEMNGIKEKISPEHYQYRENVMLYHQKYKPHEKADIIYKRIENNLT